ncbi:MAG: DUF3418 domain-containing protein, partial [Myxococcales bacterium]|nr:DUF3418 domain-containing protein [Myxococcales bacterium]
MWPSCSALGQRARELWAKAPRARHERAGLTSWDFDELPASVTVAVGGRALLAYPALVDAERAVDLRLLESAEAAAAATRDGLRRLVLLQLGTPLAKLENQLPPALASGPLVAPRAPSPRQQLALRALDLAFGLTPADPLPRRKAEFTARMSAGRGELAATLVRLGRAAVEVSAEVDKTAAAIKGLAARPGHPRAALDDLRSQLAHLAPPDLLRVTPEGRLAHIVRYLRAIQVRLPRLIHDPRKDDAKAAPVTPLWQR